MTTNDNGMGLAHRITTFGPAIGVTFAVVGLVGYLVVGVLALFGVESLRQLLLDNPRANIGIPCSALAAFVVVSTLWAAFPPKKTDGQMQVKILGLEFTGPSGPISLWVVSFLAFILAIRLLMLDR
jgi:hypothetical protein